MKMKDNFSTDGVNGNKDFKYTRSRIFVLCLWSDQCEFMVSFMVFNLPTGPGFNLVGNFSFFNSHFLVTTLELELLSGANLHKFTVCSLPSDKIARSMEPARLVLFCLIDRNTAAFTNVVLL